MIAVFLFLVSLTVVSWALPETSPKLAQQSTTDETEAKDAQMATSEAGFSVSKYPQVVKLLFARSLVDVAYLMVETTFALYTSHRFDLSTKQTGMVLSYAGLLTVITTLFGIPNLTR